jgi:tetratricopeptide (TPR) repeat protein
MYEQALSDINEAIRLQYDFAWAYFTRALIHKNMQKNDEAKSDIGLCLEYTTDPKLIEAARALAGTL